MFIRFVVGADAEHHGLLTGLVAEARLLRDRGDLYPQEEAQLHRIYDWLNENLPCPPFEAAGWSSDAVCWFKDSAGEAILRMRELAALLTEHDVPVRMLKARCPGKILYEDRYQVVVREWRVL